MAARQATLLAEGAGGRRSSRSTRRGRWRPTVGSLDEECARRDERSDRRRSRPSTRLPAPGVPAPRRGGSSALVTPAPGGQDAWFSHCTCSPADTAPRLRACDQEVKIRQRLARPDLDVPPRERPSTGVVAAGELKTVRVGPTWVARIEQ